MGFDVSQVKCYKCNDYGHLSRDCTVDVQCCNCCKYGHYSYDCTKEEYRGVYEQANIAKTCETMLLKTEVILAKEEKRFDAERIKLRGMLKLSRPRFST
ncbi:hypothetical protein RHGRI_032001 [Rhododendron griersonianum]|uniref:CCHC-type domain-containing protein n=1 Tax=Rhododendron griersonianum TaxID=479676 RepID=A0AAV6IDY2_9ERIC|nr:hypothetical protein RHGRI_032001 [Rhododendron griersonianum]